MWLSHTPVRLCLRLRTPPCRPCTSPEARSKPFPFSPLPPSSFLPLLAVAAYHVDRTEVRRIAYRKATPEIPKFELWLVRRVKGNLYLAPDVKCAGFGATGGFLRSVFVNMPGGELHAAAQAHCGMPGPRQEP